MRGCCRSDWSSVRAVLGIRGASYYRLAHRPLLAPFISPIASLHSSRPFTFSTHQPFISSTTSSPPITMSDLSVEITAPNGLKYTQPTGLFINNEFVKGNGGTITSIDPA